MRVCYLIQSHKNPEQIYRLVRAIKHMSPNSFILLSHDRNSSSIETKLFEDIPEVKVILCDGSRAAFRFFKAYFEAVEWLFNNGVEFDWLINLSGQDYPIKLLSKAEDLLSKAEYDGFMEYFMVFSKQSIWGIREGKTRYCFRYWRLADRLPEVLQKRLRFLKLINYIQPLFRVNFSYGFTFGIRRKTPFNTSYVCYGGSTFCTLKKECIKYLYSAWKENWGIIDFLKHTGVPTEVLFQTILVNSQRFKLHNESKHYFDFSQSRDGHPRTMTVEDFTKLMESSAFFARKFDMSVDSEILDLLDIKLQLQEFNSRVLPISERNALGK